MGYFQEFVGVNFWDALFTLLNTLTIFFVAKKFLFGPVMKIIAERQQEIDDMYTKAGEAKEQAKALRRAVQRLEDPQREVFILHAYGGLKLKEIAALHQKSESWARVTYVRARKTIQEVLSDET